MLATPHSGLQSPDRDKANLNSNDLKRTPPLEAAFDLAEATTALKTLSAVLTTKKDWKPELAPQI